MVWNKSNFDISNHLGRTHKCERESDGQTLS